MILNEGQFFVTKAFKEILLREGNISDIVINAKDNIDEIYFLWLKYIYVNTDYSELHLFEIDYFKELISTKFNISISRLAKIYLEGEFQKSIEIFNEDEFYQGMGFYLIYFLDKKKEFIDYKELELYLKPEKVSDSWIIPVFLKFLVFSEENIKHRFISQDNMKYIYGWFINIYDLNSDKDSIFTYFYNKIKYHFLSRNGFCINQSNNISLIDYSIEFDKNFSRIKNLDSLINEKSNLIGDSLGFYLTGGVTLIGMAEGELGIGEDIRQVSKCFDSCQHIDYSIFSFPKKISSTNSNKEVTDKIKDYILYDTIIFNLTAEETLRFFMTYGEKVKNNRYIIAYWPWELSKFPDYLISVFDFVDEIWAPSKFIESSIKNITSKPIYYMGLPVDYDLKKEKKKSNNDKFTVLTIFDGLSYPSRKNIFNSINAFLMAAKNKNMLYIIKTMNLEKTCIYNEVIEIINEHDNIVLINECYSRDEALELISSSDCLLSIHRSEGFGRVIAEAMLLKTLVITSNYSGNIDFSTENNCLLVSGKMVKVNEKEYPYYKEQVWFEPSVRVASEQILNAYNLSKSNLEKLTINAFKTITSSFSTKVMIKKYEDRLDKIWKHIFKRDNSMYDVNFYRLYNQDLRNVDYSDHMFKYGVLENRNLSIFSLRMNKNLEGSNARINKEVKKILVSIHSYYFEENENLSRYLNNLKFHDFDVIVNIPDNVATQEHIDFIKKTYKNLVKINISENRGRDVGGFITNINSVKLDDYDIVFILHTKKSPQNKSEYTDYWKSVMLESILGSVKKTEICINLLRKNNDIGAVGSLEWKSTHMNDNKDFVDKLFNDLKINKGHRDLEYLSGSMFAIKANLLVDIVDNISFLDFELTTHKSKEFLFDGQLEHAVERIYGSLLKSKNQKIKWL